jgi:hypothetical protein
MDKNSALLWFPAIEAAGLPVPRTILIEYDHAEFMGIIEDGRVVSVSVQAKVREVTEACCKIGYPCFLRTDLTSAKHQGPDYYMVNDESEVMIKLFRTIEDSEIKLWPHAKSSALMVREFLDLNASFTAFHRLPIAREFRMFADSEKLLCHHPYWPEDSIQFYDGIEPAGWKEALRHHHNEPGCLQGISLMAIKAARACGSNAWSVDFAEDAHGKWWLIDMARAEDSYHWPGCLAAFR